MNARKILRLAIFSNLVLVLASIQNARADPVKVESPCDKDGPFAPRVDQDLLRKDLVIEPIELPRVRDKRGRTPKQARERGVCQDAQTGKPVILPDPPRRSGKQVYPGGDEGDPSLPRGDDRDLRRSNRRGDADPPFFLRTTVFPPEDRVWQTPTTSFPFRAVVGLHIKFPLTPSDKAKACTGSLIGDKHVLTAGHCVFLSSQGGWATSIRAMPGLDGKLEPFEQEFIEPFGHAFMVQKRSVTCWSESNDWECDYGLITLDKTFNVGTFGLLSLSDDTLETSWAQIIGYPEIGKPPGTQQFFVPGGGWIWDYGSKHVEFKIDATHGNSGSGIYRFWNGKRAIYAIVSGEQPTYNVGMRITKNRHDLIRGWQCDDGTQSAC
jgi:V8-like Glu-specific endopeptidase